jgi:GntR family transcriptional regulator/MocR family aminotransferase
LVKTEKAADFWGLCMQKSTLLEWIVIDRQFSTALFKQVVAQIRDAILAGTIEPGTRLPASRALARDLCVSRITITQAYDQLAAEGFLLTKRGSGTRVSDALAPAKMLKLMKAREAHQEPKDNFPWHLNELYGDINTALAFQPGIPAFDAFPHRVWSRKLAEHALRRSIYMLDYGQVGGLGILRKEICGYLRRSRGVRCSPEQIIVVTSVRSAIAAASTVLTPLGSRIAVEDPGYVVARRVLSRLGHVILPIPVDERGVRTDSLAQMGGTIAGVYLTPSHHWPTGVTLAAERRLELLNWALETDAWVFEDDYDSEFRFDSPPLETLHSLSSDRVIYIGTFSKTFAPSVRVAYIVVPQDHRRAFETFAFEAAIEPALHVQSALASFLSEGLFVRHVFQMRKLYAKRRACLIEAVRAVFGDRLHLTVPAGGLQIIATLPEGVCAEEFSARAATAHCYIRTLASNFIDRPALNAIHLGFAAVPEQDIKTAVQDLYEAVKTLF